MIRVGLYKQIHNMIVVVPRYYVVFVNKKRLNINNLLRIYLKNNKFYYPLCALNTISVTGFGFLGNLRRDRMGT